MLDELAAATHFTPSLEQAMLAQLAFATLDCCQDAFPNPKKLPSMDWLVFCKIPHPPLPAPETRTMSPMTGAAGS